MDTLDYSGDGLNQGSKVVIAASGEKRRDLASEIPSSFKAANLIKNMKLAMRGVVVMETSESSDVASIAKSLTQSIGQAILTGRGFPSSC